MTAHTKEIFIKRISINFESNSIQVDSDIIAREDGVEYARNETTRPFSPVEIEGFKKYIGKESGLEVDTAKALWTPEVVQAHKDLMEAQRLADLDVKPR